MARVLGSALRDGSLDFMHGCRLGVEVTDLGLCWVVAREGDVLRVIDDEPEAIVPR